MSDSDLICWKRDVAELVCREWGVAVLVCWKRGVADLIRSKRGVADLVCWERGMADSVRRERGVADEGKGVDICEGSILSSQSRESA